MLFTLAHLHALEKQFPILGSMDIFQGLGEKNKTKGAGKHPL